VTLPDEELRAIKETRKFLLDLSDRTEKRIPSATRARARRCLRHFPYDVVIEDRYPDVPKERR
jgi:hypothetical protein